MNKVYFLGLVVLLGLFSSCDSERDDNESEQKVENKEQQVEVVKVRAVPTKIPRWLFDKRKITSLKVQTTSGGVYPTIMMRVEENYFEIEFEYMISKENTFPVFRRYSLPLYGDNYDIEEKMLDSNTYQMTISGETTRSGKVYKYKEEITFTNTKETKDNRRYIKISAKPRGQLTGYYHEYINEKIFKFPM